MQKSLSLFSSKLMQCALLLLMVTMIPFMGVSQRVSKNTEAKETLPFVLSPFNNIIFKAVLNETDTLNLKFDTGATGLLLTHDAILGKTHLLENKPDSFETQNYVPLEKLATLQLGGLSWDSLEVFPVRHSGQGSDGRFGWDLFKDNVVILDYDNSEMTVQDTLPNLAGYTSTKIINSHGAFCLEGTLSLKDTVLKGGFLFDTGYQKALLLDSTIGSNTDLIKGLKVITVNKLRNGAGKVFITKLVELPAMELAKHSLVNIPTQLLNTSNPASFQTHILGNELLKRFNTVFDFKEMQLYLKPNSLWNLPYDDAI